MQPLSISGNQSSQAYGQDPGGAVIQGDVIKATVVDKLGDELYLLKVGSQTIEAKVAADLQEGSEYQFVVEKGGTPPELSLLNEGADQKAQSNGLTAEENRWLNRFLVASGKEGLQISPKELLVFLNSIGYSTEANPEEVAVRVEKILNLLQQI
ncbi:MAG: hypothetical protein HQL32_17495, partial [Planctomycetes bacterium]|nr:hypothetical protein [Planctomycetota bacterium]